MPTDEMKERIQQLKELAEKATPGPWLSSMDSNAVTTERGEWIFQLWSKDESDFRNFFANREYVSKVDPQSILVLISELERLQGENERLKEEVSQRKG